MIVFLIPYEQKNVLCRYFVHFSLDVPWLQVWTEPWQALNIFNCDTIPSWIVNDNQSLIPYLLIDWMNSSLLTSPSPFVSAALNACSASIISFWSLTSRKSKNSSKDRYPSSFFQYLLTNIFRRCSKIHKLKLWSPISYFKYPLSLVSKIVSQSCLLSSSSMAFLITVSIIWEEVNQ